MIKTASLSGKAHLNIFGDIRHVLEGTVDPKRVPVLDLKTVSYGLGAGRYENPDFFGETIVLNHIAWGQVCSQSEEPVTEKVKNKLDTPFLLSIEIQNDPPSLTNIENLAFIECIEELARQFEHGYAFLGDALFSVFEGAYLKRSPIFGENINDHKQKYWEFPGAQMDIQAFLFGVVLSDKGKEKLSNSEMAFYHNPNEQRHSPFSFHVHAALCGSHQLPRSFGEMQNLFLETPLFGIRHFLAQSMLKKGTFALFDLIV